MKKLFKVIVAILSVILLTFTANAQTSAEMSMRNDYPNLMNKYGGLLEQQNAHYIFAVDVSSSMRQYEATVKDNFLAFINAIPDGDQVTLIRMADKAHTDYVGMFKSITLNSQVRNDLKNVIYSNQFEFLTNGHSHDGSDGYKMAELVIEAINTIGSKDLTFVYMFTDFEYWTKEYKYNPSKEDWGGLRDKMPKQKQFSICKYGLELNSNNSNLRQHAIIKRQLDEVFGVIDYQEVSSAAVLSQWFGHTIANVMAVKLNSLVKRDWNAFDESVSCEIRSNGASLEAVITCDPTNLISEFQVGTVHGDSNIKKDDVCTIDISKKSHAFLGEYVAEPEAWMPSYKMFGGDPITVSIGYVSPYQNEIERLQEVCKDGNRSKTTFTYNGTIPQVRAWNSYIPLWGWITAGVILLLIIVSVLYTIFGIKLNREWQVTVTRRDASGSRIREFSSYLIAPDDIHSYKDKKKTNDWVVTLSAKKYNPLNVFKLGKTGYYISLKQGSFLEVMDPYNQKAALHTLAVGDEVFVCPHRKPNQIILQINTTGNTYKIVII